MLDVEHSLHYLPTSVEKWYVSNELTLLFWGRLSHDSQYLHRVDLVYRDCRRHRRCASRRYGARHLERRHRHQHNSRGGGYGAALCRRSAEYPPRGPRPKPLYNQSEGRTNLEDLNSFVPNFKIAADRATSSTINVY